MCLAHNQVVPFYFLTVLYGYIVKLALKLLTICKLWYGFKDLIVIQRQCGFLFRFLFIYSWHVLPTQWSSTNVVAFVLFFFYLSGEEYCNIKTSNSHWLQFFINVRDIHLVKGQFVWLIQYHRNSYVYTCLWHKHRRCIFPLRMVHVPFNLC